MLTVLVQMKCDCDVRRQGCSFLNPQTRDDDALLTRGNYLMGHPMIFGGGLIATEGMAGDSPSPTCLASMFLSHSILQGACLLGRRLHKRLPATINLRLNIAYIA
jgi:hypothetical protein